MKKHQILKITRTALLVNSFLMAVTLGILSGLIWHNSLSATDNPDAEGLTLGFRILYGVMHWSIILFYLLNGYVTRFKLNYLIALLFFGIWFFDMYRYYWIHTILTVSGFALAVYYQIRYALKPSRYVEIFSGSAAILVFVVSYFTSMHFMAGEIVALACVAIGMYRHTNIYLI